MPHASRSAKDVRVGRQEFLEDRQGRTFADVLDDSERVFNVVLKFFQDGERQRRMEEAEIHHDRPALAGVVRELEADPVIDHFLAAEHPRRAKRLRQAVGALVRMIMERRGWKKTGKKGSLGVRVARGSAGDPGAYHNTGGLAFWFLRAERYEPLDGPPYRSVRQRAALKKPGKSGAGRVDGKSRARARPQSGESVEN